MRTNNDKEYLQRLTKNLIQKHHFCSRQFLSLPQKGFIEHVKLALEVDDVKNMKPETLGKIVCAFQQGDVMVTQKEILENVHFSGNCGDFLREMVALFLAYMILEILNEIDLSVWNE